MPPPLTYRYASIKVRQRAGKTVVGVKITARDAAGNDVKLPWVEMEAEDTRALVEKLREVLDGVPPSIG